jgi:Bacterial Ig-like domain
MTRYVRRVLLGIALVLVVATPGWAALTIDSAPTPTSASPVLSFTETDPNVVSYTVSRGGVTGSCASSSILNAAATSPFTDGSLALDGSDDGLYCYIVESFAAGPTLLASTSAVVRLDNVLATAGVTSPAAAGLQQRGQVSLQANVADTGGSGVQAVHFLGDGPGSQSFDLAATINAGVASATWTPSGSNDGAWTIDVETTDVAGNVGVPGGATVSVQVDNTNPTAATFQASPASNVPLGGPISFPFNGPADGGSGIDRVDFQTSPAGANTWTTRAFDNGAPWQMNWTPVPQDDDLYDVRLLTTDNAGNTSASSLRTNIRVDNFAPVAPTALNAPLYTGLAPALSWPASASGDVVSYELVRDGTPVYSGAATSFTDAGIALDGSADGQHTYTVRAFDGALYSTPKPWTVTVDTVRPAVPGAPRSRLHAKDQSVLLDWSDSSDPNAPSGAAGTGVFRYMVRRLPAPAVPAGPGDGVEVCPPVLAPANSCTDTSPAEQTTYRYAIFAIDLAGNASLAAATSALTVPDRTKPEPPTVFRAKAKGVKIVFTWKLPAAADLERIVVVRNARRIPRSPTDGSRVYAGKGVTASRAQTAGTTVYYRAFAVDDAGNLAASKGVRVRLPRFRLFPESGSEVTGNVNLRWKRVARASYYNVQIYAAGKKIVDTWPAGTRFRLGAANLVKGRTYTWYVWPGFGSKAAARYGSRIGKSTFVWLG